MTKNYYRSEYSDKQWKALIDKATELSCQITYSKYGNIVTIDSTYRESLIIAQTGRMSSKRTYIATFWRGNPQLKNGGYYTTKEFQAVSHKAAERQAERYTKGMIYGSLNLISVELKQENSNGE